MAMRRISVAVATGVLLVWAVPSAAQGAVAERRVRCGDTIVRNTMLTNDLINCPGNGIVIGADDVTLDLNGRTIDGVGGPDQYGILSSGHRGLTIRDGTIRQFYDAVFITAGSGVHVHDVEMPRQVHGGIGIVDSAGVLVERNVSNNALTGIYLEDSHHVRVERNTAAGNEVTGIVLFGSSDNRIVANTLSGSNEGGIGIFYDSDSNHVERNSLTQNNYGIVVGAGDETTRSEHNVLVGNSAVANLDGIALLYSSRHTVVAKNTLRDNGFTGLAMLRATTMRSARTP